MNKSISIIALKLGHYKKLTLINTYLRGRRRRWLGLPCRCRDLNRSRRSSGRWWRHYLRRLNSLGLGRVGDRHRLNWLDGGRALDNLKQIDINLNCGITIRVTRLSLPFKSNYTLCRMYTYNICLYKINLRNIHRSTVDSSQVSQRWTLSLSPHARTPARR